MHSRFYIRLGTAFLQRHDVHSQTYNHHISACSYKQKLHCFSSVARFESAQPVPAILKSRIIDGKKPKGEWKTCENGKKICQPSSEISVQRYDRQILDDICSYLVSFVPGLKRPVRSTQNSLLFPVRDHYASDVGSWYVKANLTVAEIWHERPYSSTRTALSGSKTSVFDQESASTGLGSIDWKKQLREYQQHAHPSKVELLQYSYNDLVGRSNHHYCAVEIVESNQKFISLASSRNIRHAEQGAAKEAVEWLVKQGFMPSNGSAEWPKLPTTLRSFERLEAWLKNDQMAEEHDVFQKSPHKMDLALTLGSLLHRTASRPKLENLLTHEVELLRSHLFNEEDILTWARIVLLRDPNEGAQKLLSLPRVPSFLLLHVLNRRLTKVNLLERVLIYSSNHLKNSLPSEATSEDSLLDPIVLHIFRRLAYSCGELWPRKITTVAQMAVSTMVSLYNASSFKKDVHQLQLNAFFNQMLEILGQPTTVNPFKNMTYNWEAQKVMLRWAESFETPLLLNRTGYQSVCKVLAAQKKTSEETKVTTLSTRTWPPWRVEQDGMDAQRIKEDDNSRVVSALRQMAESGFYESVLDRALRIYGGQEPDGTPTIHSRTLIAPSRVSKSVQLEWAARVEATRDSQEAWSAFSKFRDSGGKPGWIMYLAMFKKLQFENSRLEFDRTSYGSRSRYLKPIPGEGGELMAPSNDNYSNFYQKQLQPPSIKQLYASMKAVNIQDSPGSDLLRFLVSHARTPEDAVEYLHDFHVDKQVIDYLSGRSDLNLANLKVNIPGPLLSSFVQMLCRFVPRNIEVGEAGARTLNRHRLHPPFVNPLAQAIKLVDEVKPTFRPVWYSVLAALSRRGTIVDHSAGPYNDMKSWRLLTIVLHSFLSNNMELDPLGFYFICRGIEKAILASMAVENSDPITNQSLEFRVVADEFLKITEHSQTNPSELLFDLGWVHMHMYVRVLGLLGDCERIIQVLEWMKKYHKLLKSDAFKKRNGYRMMRRTLVAVRIFLAESAYAVPAEILVDSVKSWRGWPSWEEAQHYIDRGSRTAPFDDELENVAPEEDFFNIYISEDADQED